MRAGRNVVAVIAVVLGLHVSLAHAEPPAPESPAHEHYRRGTAAYNLGKYAEAAKEYEQAYEATLDPALLFNVAQSYRLAGDRKKAITTYRSYLRSAPNGSQRGLAEQKLKELESQPNTDVPPTSFPPPTAPPTATDLAPPSASSPLATATPTPSPPPSAPPPAAPELATTADASPAAALTLESAPQSEPPFYKRGTFWVITGAVVVGVVVAAILLSGDPATPTPDTNLGTMRF